MEKLQKYFLPGSKVWNMPNSKKMKAIQSLVTVAAVILLIGGLFALSLFEDGAIMLIGFVFCSAVFIAAVVWVAQNSNKQKLIYLEENGVLYQLFPNETNATAIGAMNGGLIGAAIGAAIDAAADKTQTFVGVFGMAHDRKATVYQIARVEEIVEAEKQFKLTCTGYLLKSNGSFSALKTKKLAVSKGYSGIDSLMATFYSLKH